MTPPAPRLLAFAGSLREASYNRRLIPVLAEGAGTAGAQVSLIELRDFPLPVYDGDIEAAGMPDNVRLLQQLLREHDGLLISTPEYNGSMPALVKNTLDWISRRMPARTSSSDSILPPSPLYLPRWASSARALRWTSSASRPSGDST